MKRAESFALFVLAGALLVGCGAEPRQMEQVGALLAQEWSDTIVASYNGTDITASDV